MIPSVEVPEGASVSNQTFKQARQDSDDSTTASSKLHRRSTMTNHELSLQSHFPLSKEVAGVDSKTSTTSAATTTTTPRISLIEKSVIIHRDENGFGLRVKGQSPVFVEHVHDNGAAWRAGVRKYDLISKVNGNSVSQLDHKEVVLMFKSCSRFVGLTLLSSPASATCLHRHHHSHHHARQSSEGNINVPTNQFQLSAHNRDTDEQPRPPPLRRHTREEATNEQQQHQQSSKCSCYQSQQQLLRRRRLLLSASSASGGGSTKTLPSLNLKHQQQQQQYQYQLSAPGKKEADDSQSEYHRHQCDCTSSSSGRLRRSSHKLSLISSPSSLSSSRHQHNSADLESSVATTTTPTTTLLTGNHNQCDCQQQLNDNNNNNNTTTTTTASSQAEVAAMARRAEQQQPCHLSVPQQSSCSATATANGDTTTICICLSCRQSLLQIAAEQRTRDSAMDSCEQCRLMRSSAAPRLSSSVNNSKYRSIHQRDFQQQQQQTPKSMKQQETSQQYAGSNKLCQSASTSSLPTTESHPNKTTSKPVQQAPARAPQTNKRLEIIRELIDTEKTHTDRLRCLDELFYRPLKSGGYMTSEQLRSVFSCHRTLYKIHRQIYRILLSVNYNLYPEPLIGSALIEIFEGDLKRRLERAACNFCASQSNNVELLNKLTRRDTKVGEFLAHVTSQQMVGRLGIKDLLASCFQRLTKYPLLLENLLKATPQAPPPLVSPAKSRQKLRRSRRVSSSIEADEEYGSQEADEDEDEDEDEEDDDDATEEEDEHEAEQRKAREDSHRMMAISLAEEREFIERALVQSRQMLIRVNDSVKVAFSHNKLKEIWKRTDKYPGVPLIDITKQQVVHEGLLTLRLAKRSFDVYVLLLNDYLIILTREGQDKYRLKFFTPDGKSSSSASSSSNNNTGGNNTGQGSGVYSPVFVIDEHLTTRDAATDENGFYLLCKRKDDSRIYEFASRSPAERSRWRDKIQWTIERQMGKSDRRRSSCESAITKSSSEISSNRGDNEDNVSTTTAAPEGGAGNFLSVGGGGGAGAGDNKPLPSSIREEKETSSTLTPNEPGSSGKDKGGGGTLTKIEGTISLVEDDGIIQPHKMESTQAQVDQAIQVNICDRLVDRPTVTARTTNTPIQTTS